MGDVRLSGADDVYRAAVLIHESAFTIQRAIADLGEILERQQLFMELFMERWLDSFNQIMKKRNA